jgi:hypothetical protein
MRAILLPIFATFFSTSAIAAPSCVASFEAPPTWKQTPSGYSIANDAAKISAVECEMLERNLNDTEFSEYIGEEEPEESPALKDFGQWRGRIWQMNGEGTELQWFLMKERFYVHVVVQGRTHLSESLEDEISRTMATMKVSKPQ